MNEEREKQIRKDAALQAAEKAEESLAGQGLSQTAIDTIKRDILGIG
ncbi:phage protein Gp27 family protein [Methylophaga nitratireducenticrescens]|nr:phage protein Gp27 family protein [Methylophaga nitratireducenticrescens]